jgi:hypothetical protein
MDALGRPHRSVFSLPIIEQLVKVATLMFGFSLLLTGCDRQGDARLRSEIAGTWAMARRHPDGSSVSNTVTISRSGRYVSQATMRDPYGSIRTTRCEGIVEIKDGVVTDTMTKDSNTNALLPVSSPMRIVRIDERQLVLAWNFPTNEVIFRRVTK